MTKWERNQYLISCSIPCNNAVELPKLQGIQWLCKNYLYSWSCAAMTKWAVSPYEIRGAHLPIYLGEVFLPSAPLFSTILTSFFLAGLSGNIVPEKQPPSAAAVKNFHVSNCLLQINLKSINSDLIAALNRQIWPLCLRISLRISF